VKFIKVGLLLVIPLLLLSTLVVLATGAIPYKVYVIHTGSMTPTIPPGSAVIVHEGHYQIGQVVTFTENGLTVTHRLVSINAQGLTTTKGDANATVDPWHVPKSQIVGGVVAAPRYLGYWITYLKSPLGLGSVVLVVIVLWQVWTISEGSPNETGSDEGGSSRPKRRRTRRKGSEEPGGDVVTTPPEAFVVDGAVHDDPLASSYGDEIPTVTHEHLEGRVDATRGASSVLVIEDSAPGVVMAPSVEELDIVEHVEHVDMTIVAPEGTVERAGEPAVADAQDGPSSSSEASLPDEPTIEVHDEGSSDEDAFTATSLERVESPQVEDEERRRARMAKWFGVVQNGSKQISRGGVS